MASSIGGISGNTTLQYAPKAVSSRVEQAFSKLDTGNKGYLDKTDLEQVASKVAADKPANAAKPAPSVDELLKTLDPNGDGKVTKQEFADGLKSLASQDQVKTGQPPPGAKGQSAGAPPAPSSGASPVSTTKTYDAADTNQDGTVSEQERTAYQETPAYQSANPNVQTEQDSSKRTESARTAARLQEAYAQSNKASEQSQRNAINVTA